jgi:uncharacterized MnhB-related membrane protein
MLYLVIDCILFYSLLFLCFEKLLQAKVIFSGIVSQYCCKIFHLKGSNSVRIIAKFPSGMAKDRIIAKFPQV